MLAESNSKSDHGFCCLGFRGLGAEGLGLWVQGVGLSILSDCHP